MSIKLSKRRKVIIYGAGKRGRIIANLLNKRGYTISCFIDENASNIEFIDNIPVIFLGNLYSVKKYDKSLFIIALQNALQHEEIAKKLYAMGCKYILFLPFSKIYNIDEVTSIRHIYNEMLNGNMKKNIKIASYIDLLNKQIDENKSDDCLITYYVDINYLFSCDSIENTFPENDVFGENRVKLNKKYSDKPIFLYEPYLNLFEYLDKGSELNNEYIQMQLFGDDFSCIEMKKMKILRDRYKLFRIYEEAWNLNMNFFYESAPYVTWNDRGYFNICDGHHRATYLIYKGLRSIPVCMKRKDYKMYCKFIKNDAHIHDYLLIQRVVKIYEYIYALNKDFKVLYSFDKDIISRLNTMFTNEFIHVNEYEHCLNSNIVLLTDSIEIVNEFSDNVPNIISIIYDGPYNLNCGKSFEYYDGNQKCYITFIDVYKKL